LRDKAEEILAKHGIHYQNGITAIENVDVPKLIKNIAGLLEEYEFFKEQGFQTGLKHAVEIAEKHWHQDEDNPNTDKCCGKDITKAIKSEIKGENDGKKLVSASLYSFHPPFIG